MIGSLRGTVIQRVPPSTVLIEVQGVGYLCSVTSATFAELEPTVAAFVHVHHHIREDSQTLFGFTDRSERDMFEILIATHGIGPSMAMAILSVYPPAGLLAIVAATDTAALTAVPGVGKKTAERLMIELKSRLGAADVFSLAGDAAVSSAAADVREALTSLGYAHEEIRDVMRTLDGDGSAETMLRDALARLGAGRAG